MSCERSGKAGPSCPSSVEEGPRVVGDDPGRDPFGHIWWVVARVEDVSEEEMWKRLREPGYAEVLRVSRETFDAELGGRSRGRGSAPVRTTG